MSEQPETPQPRSRLRKWAILALVGFLIIMALGAITYAVQLTKPFKPIRTRYAEYREVMQPRQGFYTGYIAGDVLVWAFYDHPQYGQYILLDGDLLPTDLIHFYVFTWREPGKNVSICLEEYKLTTIGNTTVRTDNRTYETSIYAPARHFVKVSVRLASTKEEKLVDVWVNNVLIMRLRHKTFPAFTPVGPYTLGSLEADRAGFMALTALVALIALAFSKTTINKVKWVPDLPPWAYILGFMILLGSIGSAWFLIRYYALIRAVHLTIPIGIVMYFYGLLLMRIRPSAFYFSRLHVGAGQPRKDLIVYDVVRKLSEDEYELAPASWRQFFRTLLGKKRTLRLATPDGFTPLWYIDLGMGDREYIFREIHENGPNTTVLIAPLHALDVEKWTYERLGVEDLARDKEELRHQLHHIRATMELEIDRRTRENVLYYWELRRRCFLGPRGPRPPMPTVEEKVGEGAVEGTPERAETSTEGEGGGGEAAS